MPLLLTLRDVEGTAFATAMLATTGKPGTAFEIIIVGPDDSDPYVSQLRQSGLWSIISASRSSAPGAIRIADTYVGHGSS